ARTEALTPEIANSHLAVHRGCAADRAGREYEDAAFIRAAFLRILGRLPTHDEQSTCEEYLITQFKCLSDGSRLTPFAAGPASSVPPATDPGERAREDLVHVLFNHNDFVTIR